MFVKGDPKKVKLELMSDEIDELIDVLERVPYVLYRCLGYGRIIEKLKSAKRKGLKNEM